MGPKDNPTMMPVVTQFKLSAKHILRIITKHRIIEAFSNIIQKTVFVF